MKLAFCLLALCLSCVLTQGGERPLTLTNLLASVEAHYPAVVSALKKREAAEGKALSAKGAFDLKFKLNSRNDPLGFYENRILEALLEQPTPYRGTRLFGGWRRGDGLFPLQEEKRETQSGGEFLFGVSTPLLRDGRIDAARAGIQRTQIDVESERARVEQIRLLVQQSAAAQLLKWSAALQKQAVREKLLNLALIRDQAIRDQVDIGDKAKVDIIDNQRLIAARREGVIAARQAASEEAVNLSLYWRDDTGEPRTPDSLANGRLLETSLLGDMPPVAEALASHPMAQIFQRALEAEGVTQRLSENQLLPQLDLALSVSKDVGDGSRTKNETEFRIGALLEYPFQNRKARGNLASSRAKISAIEQELRLVIDKLRASAMVADNNIRQLNERLERLHERLERSREMRQAETDRVELQLSDLLRLNLREQDVAAAETALIDTRLELRLAELNRINAPAVDLAPVESRQRARLRESGGRPRKKLGQPPFPALHPRSRERGHGNAEELPPPFRNRTPRQP